jgi:hypothetical protein
MKYIASTWIIFFLLFFANQALSECPMGGTFSTAGPYSILLPGRLSEAWCGTQGESPMPQRPGNELNIMSWNGVALGTQWRFWGMQIDENGVIETDRLLDEWGNGWIEYKIYYTGGQFWLSKDYP